MSFLSMCSRTTRRRRTESGESCGATCAESVRTQSGGKLWCGTCHDPHVKPTNVTAFYRERCLSCHGAKLLKIHPQPAQDCVGCHMQRQTAKDGGHTAFTNHDIRKKPEILRRI